MNLDALRALSVRRPWAELIMSGSKPVENRSWSTNYRGLLVIHAGRAFDPQGEALGDQMGVQWRCEPRRQRTGYLGIVELADVHLADGWCCIPWGPSGPGVYHWALKNPRRFAAVIDLPGRQGLFRPASAVLDMLRGVA